MNVKRLKELEDFANDFNNKLQAAYDTYDKSELEAQKPMNKTMTQLEKSSKKKKTFSNSVFDEQNAWKPTRAIGTYFDKFKKLTPKYNLDNWETLRIPHMVQRSYAKPKEFACGMDIKPTKAIGQEFDQYVKRNASMMQLSTLGQNIINKFVKENTFKEQTMREKEKSLWEYQHSKPPLQINPWKPANHIIKEFIPATYDKVHAFRTARTKKFMIQEPYRIPKKDGDYFDPELKLI